MRDKIKIPFNRPFLAGNELTYISQALEERHLSGDGPFTKKCHQFLESYLNAKKVLLTHSCTAALEMAAMLCNIGVGDEVILPSYTFVSTVNAFYLRGAKPVFADVNVEDFNIDVNEIKKLITPNTKAICIVHYAGVPCDMDEIMNIAKKHNLFVIEDAAQALGVDYKGRKLGTIGDLGAFSFHETKNIISGEGGALAINNEELIERAEIIREKGTNRSKFFRGQVDKYTWVDIGSSYLPCELVAAFLYAQLENIDLINERRKEIFKKYYEKISPVASYKNIQLPLETVIERSNHHIFYLIMPSHEKQLELISFLKEDNIHAVFHYIPLHTSPIGRELHDGRELPVTSKYSERLVRLPLFLDLTDEEQARVINRVNEFIENKL